jgi:hypothetical protein
MFGMMACSSSKQTEGKTDSGKTQSAGSDGNATAGKAESKDGNGSPSSAPDAAINIQELISKMTWTAEFDNNARGRIYTGFDGTNPFKVLVGVAVYGELPGSINLSEEQLEQLYTSEAYDAAAQAETSKIAFQADAAFASVKMVDEFPGGRLYELTTVKAGSTMAKASYGTKELPLAVEIAAYTPAQVTAGRQRYNAAVAGATPSPACATCHRQATGVDHSPYYMAQFSDAALLSTIETGVNSDDGYKTQAPHVMTFTSATDKAGIVPYLRSLDPNLLPDEQAE